MNAGEQINVLNPNIHRWMNATTIAANEAAAVAAAAAAAAVATNDDPPAPAPATAVAANDDRNDVLNEELLGLLEVFPDLDVAFALQLLEEEDNDIEQVLERIADMEGTYPRDDASSETTTSEAATNGTVEDLVEQHRDREQPAPAPAPAPAAPAPAAPAKRPTYTYDFTSPTSFKPSHRYKLQSLEQLLYRFSFLDNRPLAAIFEASSCHYAIAHNKVCETILAKAGTPVEPQTGKKMDEILLCVLFDKKALKTEEVELLVDILKVKKTRKPPAIFSSFARRKKKLPHVTCPILIEELRWVQEKTTERKTTLEAQIARRKLREAAVRDGTAMVCSCCYDEYPLEEMVACRDEGHLFCGDCLAQYVETQVFGQGSLGFTKDKEAATEIQCCAGDCSSGFDRWALRKALKEKVLQKYDELQYQTTVEKAGLGESMSCCPKCELMFELPEDANFFVCPIEGCDYEACRHCGEPPHVGKKCDEVEREGEAQGRVRVEEAATAAIIRKCPSCKKGIMKEDGCNKMTCPCGTKFCYCCGKKINGYEHFCQKPHCDHSDPRKCRYKCPLYTNSFDLEIRDREAVREAALAEAARVEAENAVTSNQERPRRGSTPRKVDVESILVVPNFL